MTGSALRPPDRHGPGASPAFALGVPTSELPLHAGVVQAALLALLARGGGARGLRGVLGLGLGAASAAGLWRLYRDAQASRRVLEDALVEGLGPDYRTAIGADYLPAPEAELTRLSVLLGRLGDDLGRDRAHVSRIPAGLPDGDARVAFTRTLRSVVDWRGQVVTLLDRCYLVDDVPALGVWGDRDEVIPVHHGRQAHESLPTSRLEIFAGAGHFPHHDDPDRFVALLREFVATEPARHGRDAWRERLRQGA